MPQLKELFVEELQDLLNAETQLTKALPKMADAAKHPKLREAFEKHLEQTQMQVDRLKEIFSVIGEKANGKACKGMAGLIDEGKECMEKGGAKDPISSDLALIASAQKVEHYEISAYGTARTLARQLGYTDAAALLTRSLGEEEGADYLLTAIAKPLVQQATLDEVGASVNLERVPVAKA